MNDSIHKLLVNLFFLFPLLISAYAQVSPLDYGLREATNGIDRYHALYRAHTEAVARGLNVSYEGIDTLHLELPPDFKSVPLGTYTDFGGLVLYVTNHSAHGALFSRIATSHPVSFDKSLIDSLDFRSLPELATGHHLLVLEDLTPWTERRGYGYQQYRRDILVLNNGIAENAPVTSWNTDSTQLKATYYDFSPDLNIEVKNLTLHRVKGSTFRTYCLALVGQQGVTVSNIRVTTPRSRMIADGVFSISNCANLLFDRDTVEGTYSGYGTSRNYGYAFSMNNVYKSSFTHIKAYGNWGVFGTNNLSNTYLGDCDVDRFDIHCYGRDVQLKNCTLRGRQTLFSSMYGTVVFDSCHFIDYTPVRVRSSYNAYTPFDIIIKDCTFELTRRYHSIVQIDMLDTADNPRPELNPKCWPNLKVDNLTVVVPATIRTMNIFNPKGNVKELRREFDYINKVEINGLNSVRPNGKPYKLSLRLSTKDFKTKTPLNYSVK
ncbi:MAG: hypothetical protein J5711_04010 [Bacteroidales bacterium]|nr:hypothetical protein [Bacteroidales bacterium]